MRGFEYLEGIYKSGQISKEVSEVSPKKKE
jgi:hypothetical protein